MIFIYVLVSSFCDRVCCLCIRQNEKHLPDGTVLLISTHTAQHYISRTLVNVNTLHMLLEADFII